MCIVPFLDRKVQPPFSRVPYVHFLTWGVIALQCVLISALQQCIYTYIHTYIDIDM